MLLRKLCITILAIVSLSEPVTASDTTYCDQNKVKMDWLTKQTCLVKEIRDQLEQCSEIFDVSQIKVTGTGPVLYFQSKTTDFDCLDRDLFEGINSLDLSAFEEATFIGNFQLQENRVEYVIRNQSLHMLYTASDYGVSVNVASPDILLFSGLNATYTSNYLISLDHNDFNQLPNGKVILLDGDNFIISEIKTYGADPTKVDYPGSIWYTAVVNKTGELVDLLDEVGPNSICLGTSQIPERLRDVMMLQKKTRLCVKN